MSRCAHCESIFDRGKSQELKIDCKFCKTVFHASCVGMTSIVHSFITTSKNTSWNCDKCESFNVNLPDIIKKLSVIEKKISENSKKKDESVEPILLKLDQIEKTISENTKKLNEHESILKKVHSNVNCVPNGSVTRSGSVKRRYADVVSSGPLWSDIVDQTPKRTK